MPITLWRLNWLNYFDLFKVAGTAKPMVITSKFTLFITSERAARGSYSTELSDCTSKQPFRWSFRRPLIRKLSVVISLTSVFRERDRIHTTKWSWSCVWILPHWYIHLMHEFVPVCVHNTFCNYYYFFFFLWYWLLASSNHNAIRFVSKWDYPWLFWSHEARQKIPRGLLEFFWSILSPLKHEF